MKLLKMENKKNKEGDVIWGKRRKEKERTGKDFIRLGKSMTVRQDVLGVVSNCKDLIL